MKCTPMTVFAVSKVMKNFAHTHNEALQVQNPALALTHGKWDRIIIIFQPGLQLQQSTTVCGHVFLGSLFKAAPDTDFI